MIDLLKNKNFYLKILVAYAIVIALLYCSSMKDEQDYSGKDQIGIALEYAAGDFCELDGSAGRSAYPYAKMMNLIEQCRSIESKFHKCTTKFSVDRGYSIDKVVRLRKNISKVEERLSSERASFEAYISGSRFKGDNQDQTKVDYLCTKGKCRYTVEGSPLMSRKKQNIKTSRYTSQVLSKYIERMKIMEKRLGTLLEKSRLDDEAARALSENKAKELAKLKEEVV